MVWRGVCLVEGQGPEAAPYNTDMRDQLSDY
jgi:hypothetical protein